jgi:superfamily I DNA and RNA helicase
MPYALALSNEILDEKYDALVVDEAQDFSDDYWFAVEELLQDSGEGPLYIFIDENQALYRRHANLPVNYEPYHLTANCRNTAPIHRAGYAYYTGAAIDEPDLPGQDVHRVTAEGDTSQADAIVHAVRSLLADGLRPEDITVLLANRPKARLYALIQTHRLPAGIAWSIENPGQRNSVFVDTVGRFKGLEAPAVILWLGDETVAAEEWEVVYVGTTRAKSILYIVGSTRALSALK